MNATRLVTLPPWALTTALALRSENVGLNWTIAVTLRFGAFWATAARRFCADGAAWATVPPIANGTTVATRATLSPLRQRYFGEMDNFRAPPCALFENLFEAGGRAISRPCETSSFASPPHGGFALFQPC